ncbi:MAG: hypothetical protein Q4B28_01540 [bacterium]|nr:hypothetical protein [bacterium]
MAVVGNGASSSGYSEYCEPRPEASCHNSSYENVDLACCAWSHNGYAGHTHISPPQFNHTRCPSHAYMMGTVENGQFVEATWKNGQWSRCSVSFP